MITVSCTSCNGIQNYKKGSRAHLGCQKCGCFDMNINQDMSFECLNCHKIIGTKKDEKFTTICSECNNRTFEINPIISLEKNNADDEFTGVSITNEGKITDRLVSAVVVCMNNLEMTQHCIDRLRKNNFHQIILVDNGSSEDKISSWVNGQKDIFYIKNRMNFGCGVARNQGAKWTTGEYIFFIDNDQFVPPDLILRMLAKNSDIVGVDLWAVNQFGSCIPIQTKNSSPRFYYVGAGGMLIKKKVFVELGGFDERYAPAWYEDVDFIFRARKNGYKIDHLSESKVEHLGNKTISAQGNFDPAEEKRMSQRLFLSLWAEYLLGAPADSGELLKVKSVHKGQKPKILLAIDTHGWAWDIKAHEVAKNLSETFDFILWYGCDSQEIPRDCDLYFTFEINWAARFKAVASDKQIITGVTAHVYQNMESWVDLLSSARAIHANSMLLYNEIKKYNPSCYYLPNGVNETLFKFVPKIITKRFTAGFVGKDSKKKGFHDYIEPVCRAAQVQLSSLVGGVQRSGVVPHGKMLLFYEDVDVILIASDMDGTPNMLLEAAATGRTFIGNKIGNVPEFYTGKNGFMIDKKFDLYVEKLEWMKNNREACQQMGIEARNSVEQGWTWKIQAQNYKHMFLEILG